MPAALARLQRARHRRARSRARRRCRRRPWRSGRRRSAPARRRRHARRGRCTGIRLAPPSSSSAFLQPTRAWSKNGLFMFFGTSAKMYFCALASAPRPATIAAATSRAHQEISSCAFPPLQVIDVAPVCLLSRAVRPRICSSRTARTMKTPTKAPCQLESTPGHQQAVADDLDQRRADERRRRRRPRRPSGWRRR